VGGWPLLDREIVLEMSATQALERQVKICWRAGHNRLAAVLLPLIPVWQLPIASAALLAVVGMFGILLATGLSASAWDKAAPAKEEVFLLGPFTLADLCEKGGNFAREYAAEGGPSEADLLRSLATCKLFLVDKKVPEPKGWSFAEEGKYAKVVVDGPCRFELKDKKGSPFTIQIIRCSFLSGRTDCSTSPPTRNGIIQTVLRVENSWGTFQRTSEHHSAAAIGYNLNGATGGLKARLQR
jgi:hypothetical protein